ncbi:hypothetical protein [Candidatus Poriferisodalis sp.]|uniref:hypothetical protein n=1 Tax=Candidatus Poriferisodalis sp. TaxID=3101277 RepID=UPI003B51C655
MTPAEPNAAEPAPSGDAPSDPPELDPDCELCEAARFTHWYFEDEFCWVADCEVCATPMVVWKRHGTDPPAPELEAMLARLTDAGEQRFGSNSGIVDQVMRQIPDHFHAHYRDADWMSRRWNEPPSRYTGVGTPRVTR